MQWRHRREEPPVHPIVAFWAWWVDEGAAETAAAIGAGDFGDLPATITGHVHAIHPELVWELAAGSSAQHALIVSAGGVAEFRPLAERWRRAAPPASPTWEYHAARRADPDAVRQRLDIAGVSLALDDIRFGLAVDDDRARVDVTVFHPLFARMSGSGPAQVSFLVLDWLLGEDDVERWVGGVETVTTPPADPRPAAALTEVADTFRRQDRSAEWALLEGSTDDGRRVIVTVRRFLRWIDHPLLDQHHALTVAYTAVRPDGLPEPDALDALRFVEDELDGVLAGRGELVAVESSAGRRTWHVYTDSEDQNSADLVTQFATARGATHTTEPDPAWHAVRPFQ